MDRNLIKLCIFFMVYSVILRPVESSPSNETTSDENRHPRVSGRIVKLYSGYKTEPVTCIEEGFQADPVDCSTFYRCIKAKSGKFSVLRFQCGPGTVYDPDTEICNHPHSTKRSECGRSRPIQFLPAPVARDNENDIESSADELPSPINTRKPLTVDQTSAWYRPNVGPSTTGYQSMTSADDIHKPIEVNKPGDLSTSKTSVVSTVYPWSTTTSSARHPKVTITHPTSEQSHKIVDETKNECNHDGFMGDNMDCRKFYRCVNNQRGGFTKYEFMCSESTIWDDDMQSCNHPWAVRRSRCKQNDWGQNFLFSGNDYYFHKTNISSEDSISQSTNTLISSTQAYGHRINNDKANVEPNANNLNIPSNSYFIENEHVTPTIQHKQTQPTSYYLHPLIQTQKELHESITKSSTSVFSTDDPSYSTPYPSNKVIDIKCTESGFMGDPNDCRKFYRCVQNGKNSYIKHEFSCGEGTAWDERAESCNHAWMVKECGGKILHDMSTTRKSYIEEKPTTTESNIINEGNGYNVGDIHSREPNALPVTTSMPLNVPNKNESSEICNSAGYYGNKRDCRKFYTCIENDYGGFTKLEYICDEGTVWDSKIEACNHAGVVKNCKVDENSASKFSTPSTESTIVTTVSFIQSTIQSGSHSSYNDEVQEVSYHKESTPNIVTTNTDNQCQENGFMADRNDCRKFFICVENGNNGFIRYQYSCGDGTAWDTKINACNHLRAVPTCGNDYDSESTPIKQPPLESDENINSYITQINEINVNTLRTESTTAINSATKLTTTNNKLNVCTRSGFVGDSSNCKKFYRCVSNGDGSYMMHEFSCGEGTVWDPEIEACNHASAVKRCGGILETQNDAQTMLPQPPTTMTSVNYELDNGYAQNFGEKESSVNNNLQSSSENPPVYDKTQECNKVGFMADRRDCKKFYRCVENGQGGFNRYEFSCGDGTAWDQSKEACDHISSVKECASITNDVSSSTITSTQSEPPVHSNAISYPQHDDVPTTVKPTKQKDDCLAEGFYSNPSDCKKFYRCVSNQQEGFIKYEFSCGEGTVWDQNIQACNHEYSDNMNCTTSSTSVSKPEPSETVNKPSNSQESQDNASSNEISTTEKHMDLPPKRNNSCSSEGFHPNLEDCKRFIRCVNNGDGHYVRYDFTCGEGTIWVQDIQACDHDNDNSTCSNGISTSTETHPFTTQGTQTVTSSTMQSTITSTNTEPTENSVAIISNTDKCNTEGYFGDSNDCQRFYRCVADDHGSFIKYDYICGEGTAWDLDRQSCNHINSVKRCTNMQDSQTTTLETQVVPQTTENIKSTISPTTSVVQPQTTENIKPTNIAQPQTTEQIKTTTTLTTRITQPQTTKNIQTTQSTSTPIVTSMQEDSSTSDGCNDEGYFGNKENCQKFYRCVNNGKGGYTKYDYICGEGTVWDQDILACNHPRDVKNPSCNEDSKTSPSSVSTEPSIQSTESMSSSSQSSLTSTTSKQTTASSTESSSQGTSNCSSNENVKNDSITCTKAGYFPNPNDCKKFYRCVDWDNNGERFSIFHFECGEGTIWDPALDTCNYEDSVYPPRNCKGSQAQNDSTTTTASSMSTETTTPTTQPTQQTAATDSTTQQMTSIESTTQQITSTESTTQQITSTESTTQQFSSTQSTTEQITSTESSTSQSTSTESTTQQITSTESTTQQMSSTESTTQQITSTQSTTQQQLSTDTTTTQSTTTIEQSTTQQTTPTTETTTTEQTTTSQATSTTTEQPTTSEKSTTESTTVTESQPTSTTGEQSSTEQSTTETSQQSSTVQSTTTEETTSTTVQQSTELSTESQTSSTTENGMNTTTESTQETTSTESSSTNKCPDTESDQYLYACPTSFKRHPKYCNLFYQCLEDNDSHELKIAVFNCPNGTIYDETKIQCVEESNAQKKCDGAIAQKRRFKRLNVDSKEIITASKNSYRCPRVGHFPFEKNEECSPALLRCDISKSGKLRGFVYRCPENYVYWSISRKCEPISKMPHCKNSTSQWAKRPEIPIERKNVGH